MWGLSARALSSTAIVSTFATLRFLSSSLARCDDEQSNPLLDQANAIRENSKPRIKTPPDFEGCKNSFQYVQTNSYDGFRFIVQKQINLNSLVNHFFWTGAKQFEGGSFYQYRIILPLNDNTTVIDASSTMDADVSINVKQTLSPQLRLDCNIDLKSQQPKSIAFDLNYHDTNSTLTGQYVESAARLFGLSMTQAITPEVTLGASALLNWKKTSLVKSFYAAYDKDENAISAFMEENKGFKALYMRRVNPGRVNVFTDVQTNGKGESLANLGAEFTLKASKLNMSVDSNITWRSTLDTQVMPGVNLSFAAEVNQREDQYRYGLSLQLM